MNTPVSGPSGEDTSVIASFLRSMMPNFTPEAGGANAAAVEELQGSFENLPPSQQRRRVFYIT